ncbi:MAG TPA: HAD-IA family hydrolase [Conexibacter sp.]|nr:HAD-IA family hydrolase [Conexibacter sp.]
MGPLTPAPQDGPAQAVVFDCDGVLVDSERLAGPILAALLTELGLPTTPADVDRDFKGRSWEHGLEVIRARRGGTEPWPQLRERYRARLFEVFDAELEAIAGVAAALDALDAAGVPRCVASSGDHERIRRGLRAAGLLERFPEQTIFSVEDVAHGKPAPDLFLHAAAQMGFDPATTTVVEDSAAGVQAGVAAGMRVLGYAEGEAAAALRAAGAEPFGAMARLPALLGVPAAADR